MSDHLLLDVDAATELHQTMFATAGDLDLDRTALREMFVDVERLAGSPADDPDPWLRDLAETLRHEAADLARRLRMVIFGGPEINAGLLALDQIREHFDVIDNRGGHAGDRDGIVSRSDLEWAVEHLDADTSAAAQWLLDHEDFFGSVETARDNDDYLAAGATELAGSGGGDGRLSLGDVESYVTKLDTWATLIPYMATIDVAARGGDHDAVMSRDDFEAFLADHDLPPDVRAAAQQVLDDGAFHDTGGLVSWGTLLDVASFIPIVGDVLDGAMALYYLSQGEWEQAALSGIGLVPIPGVSGGSVRAGREIVEEVGETAAQRAARETAVHSHPVSASPWADRVMHPPLSMRRGGVPDRNHSFPREVENWAPLSIHTQIPRHGPGHRVIGTDDLYQLPGAYGGNDGIFEWIVRDGIVEHRVFYPGAGATGVPGGR
jgi:hypothetical protein